MAHLNHGRVKIRENRISERNRMVLSNKEHFRIGSLLFRYELDQKEQYIYIRVSSLYQKRGTFDYKHGAVP